MLYITMRQYEYVVAVADAGSLTGAAKILHVSQPSLSNAITRVEEHLGSAVFVRRKGTPITLTPFGHRFVERARHVIAAAAGIEAGDEANEPFVVACFQDISPWFLGSALTALSATFPERVFKGREGRFSELSAYLEKGNADLAISYDIGFPEPFGRKTLASVRPTAFLSVDHPLAGTAELTLEELARHPLILFNEDLSEGFVRGLLDRMNLEYSIVQRVHSLEMMRSFAAHGVGAGISYSCPPNQTSYDGKALVQKPISTPEAVTEIKLIWSDLHKQDNFFDQAINSLTSL